MLIRRSNLLVSSTDEIPTNIDPRADAVTIDVSISPSRLAASKHSDVFIGLEMGQVGLLQGRLESGQRGVVARNISSASEIRRLETILVSFERSIRWTGQALEIVIVITNARGVWELPQLLKCSSRVSQVVLDEMALCIDLRALPDADIDACKYARGRLVVEARAAGVQPLCASPIALERTDDRQNELRAVIQDLHDMGIKGMLCPSVSWVLPVNTGFRPNAQELAFAQRARSAFARAISEGFAATTVDGRMIDLPVDTWACQLLEEDAAHTDRDSKHAQI